MMQLRRDYALLLVLNQFAYGICQLQEQDGITRLPILTHQAVRGRYLQETAGENSATSNLRKSEFFEGVTEVFQGYGAHFIDLWVGTPPQRQTVLVDTGSSTTAFPCNTCDDCGQGHHMDKNFNESKSESFQNLQCSECLRGSCTSDDKSFTDQCKLHLSYAEGSSWNAIEVSDMIHFGGFHNTSKKDDHTDISIRHLDNNGGYRVIDARENEVRMKFGCQTDMDGLFKKQLADGIMGLSNTDASFWNQMYKREAIASPKFSLCYVKHPIAHYDGANAGSLIFGGTDKRLHSSQMVYTPFLETSSFYEVHIRNIYIHPGGGEALTGEKADIKLSPTLTKRVDTTESALNKGGPIIDSGTTCLYINKEVKDAFQQAWSEIMGFEFPLSDVRIKGKELRKWPTIIFQLKGSTATVGDEEFDISNPMNVPNKAAVLDPDNPQDILIALPPSHYMEYSHRNGTYFPRLEFTTNGPRQGGNALGPVLGATLMQGHDVLFDIENKRIGIAESSCDYNYLISGKHSIEFDPFDVPSDIRRHYRQYFCSSKKCRNLVYGSFWVSHFILLCLYMCIKRKNERASRSRKTSASSVLAGLSGSVGAHTNLAIQLQQSLDVYSIKSKMSGDDNNGMMTDLMSNNDHNNN